MNTIITAGLSLPVQEFREWLGARGSLDYVRLREDIVLVVLRGHMDGDAGDNLGANLPWLFQNPCTTVFWDSGEMRSHGARVPAQVVPVLGRMRRNIEGFHVLVNSPILAMTAAGANLALGGMLSVYRERERFTDALSEALLRPAA